MLPCLPVTAGCVYVLVLSSLPDADTSPEGILPNYGQRRAVNRTSTSSQHFADAMAYIFTCICWQGGRIRSCHIQPSNPSHQNSSASGNEPFFAFLRPILWWCAQITALTNLGKKTSFRKWPVLPPPPPGCACSSDVHVLHNLPTNYRYADILSCSCACDHTRLRFGAAYRLS